jgi:hypothetical protein
MPSRSTVTSVSPSHSLRVSPSTEDGTGNQCVTVRGGYGGYGGYGGGGAGPAARVTVRYGPDGPGESDSMIPPPPDPLSGIQDSLPSLAAPH